MSQSRGTPTGSSITIGDNIDAYVAEPKGKVHEDTAIIYFPDVIGICMFLSPSLKSKSPLPLRSTTHTFQ